MKAPLTRRSTDTESFAGKSSQRRRIRLVGAGWLAVHFAAIVEGHGELDGGVPGEFAIRVAVASVGREQGPFVVPPAQSRLSDPTVHLGVDVDAEDRPKGLGAVSGTETA